MDKKDAGTNFRFRRSDRIGEAAAEVDDKYLFDCFLDTGDLEILQDCNAPQRIIVGRTGSGKSALLRNLEAKEENVIKLAPEQLALSYLSNSEVIRFFDDAGSNLDLFYQLLWRHVLTVELIKSKYKITNDAAQKSFLNSLSQLFQRDKNKQYAVDYLRKWGENFWNEAEYRVKEITGKIEQDLKASLSSNSLGISLDAGAAKKLTHEEKQEVIRIGSRVVNKVQVKALAEVIKLLADEIFNDVQKSYFIIIDDLDTKWIDDPLKYKLIRALIETVKTFRQIKNVKVIVALRLDLLQRVIAATRDSGFQSEKYESLYLKIRWNKAQIIEVLNRRISYLVKQRYTSRSIPIEELFPKKIGHTGFTDYLVDRTFLRPRDAILFVNECIERAADKGHISVQVIHDAEGAYSQKRIDSMHEEWQTIYPKVADYLRVFTRRPVQQRVSDFNEESMRDWLFNYFLDENPSEDPVKRAAQQWLNEGKLSEFRFVLILLESLYITGAISLKPEASAPDYWAYFSDYKPSEGSLRPTSVVKLHPSFWRAIGARPP